MVVNFNYNILNVILLNNVLQGSRLIDKIMITELNKIYITLANSHMNSKTPP